MLQKELAKRLKARYDAKMDGSGWLEVSSDGIPLRRIKYNWTGTDNTLYLFDAPIDKQGSSKPSSGTEKRRQEQSAVPAEKGIKKTACRRSAFNHGCDDSFKAVLFYIPKHIG